VLGDDFLWKALDLQFSKFCYNTSMKIIYSENPAFDGKDDALFLAGPSPRKPETASWRPEALRILHVLGYNGTVLVPEWKDWTAKIDYLSQVEWEAAGLSQARSIVFWIPRNMVDMPALTTNVEFGYWLAKRPTDIYYGRPDGAPHTQYLDWLYTKHGNKTPHSNMEHLLSAAVKRNG
jgi:hypothetical protein